MPGTLPCGRLRALSQAPLPRHQPRAPLPQRPGGARAASHVLGETSTLLLSTSSRAAAAAEPLPPRMRRLGAPLASALGRAVPSLRLRVICATRVDLIRAPDDPPSTIPGRTPADATNDVALEFLRDCESATTLADVGDEELAALLCVRAGEQDGGTKACRQVTRVVAHHECCVCANACSPRRLTRRYLTNRPPCAADRRRGDAKPLA